MGERVKLELDGEIAVATLNRPEKLNALDTKTRMELAEVIEGIEEVARVLIITGSGKAFAAGADINELLQRDAIKAFEATKLGTDLFSRIEELEIPVIAAVNGYTLGGGCELAMACDIRIASEKAKFGQPEINLAIIPGAGGTQRLPRLVGLGMAKKLVLTGEIIDAQTALRIGLVEEVVEHERLMERAKEVAAKIIEKSPLAVKVAKKALNASINMPLKEGLRYEASLFALLFSSEDAKEGMRAFLEKRKPEFRGR
ncbi:enoyl-CoA hydratase/isomerase family protein [Archaeoglobus fulgidus]|jgi:enoyl-CoA hydratase|uniref:Enoyl-CoA hydratase (Fad-1) n=3 Tax=Archaeoglobus fulgidus TaxID=2234 RepID=O29814_ARCFU|nr:enoyl-CoA hydratase-related protein [Archaeoglobus fulgidus]AAB90798.1 enoyl-CoA hydratase (fad-1) [Archaeoglobus fulgidus DSM 4304]AIG97253.1 Enoyl-CoA hydratase/carnithine racemase [Archaeoglobus fulgidus DSM 8774]KUJ92586.1 MAG: Enoyl-CoA hydratase (Fad-1) [Archaeoglobus fulgidus]KUK05707.1 MAG: Enoyl-CoA hydratase (Fad-1) [Archaeoglobus fulgidus]